MLLVLQFILQVAAMAVMECRSISLVVLSHMVKVVRVAVMVGEMAEAVTVVVSVVGTEAD